MKQTLMKYSTAVALAAGLAFAQAPAGRPERAQAAQGQRRAMGPRAMGMQGAQLPQRLLRNLNLTDAQREQARTIFQQGRESAQALQKQVAQDRQGLADAVKNNDTVTIQRLATAIGNAQGQLLAIRSSANAKFYAILTPEQRAKVDQFREHMGPRRKQ
jgi:Spy/CpxP family protein refolding chaperone